MTEENALLVRNDEHEEMAVAVFRDPEIVVKEAQRAAAVLNEVLSKKENPVMIHGEQYLEYEDWQTAAQFYGYAVETGDAVPFDLDGVKGAKAHAKVINMKTGLIIGGGEAYCMRDEENWKTKPWNQLASMAQTRAAVKALRNRLAWVVVLAGHKGTPAEEMQHIEATVVEKEGSLSNLVSLPQRKRFYAIAKSAGKSDESIKEYLKSKTGSDRTENITRAIYDEVCKWAETK